MDDFFIELDNSSPSQMATTQKNKGSVQDTFRSIEKLLNNEAVQNVGASFSFTLTGSEPGTWFLDLKSGNGSAGKLDPGKVKDFDVQMITSSDNFIKMFSGQLVPTKAFISGELKIKGNAFLAVKLEGLMAKVSQKAKQ